MLRNTKGTLGNKTPEGADFGGLMKAIQRKSTQKPPEALLLRYFLKGVLAGPNYYHLLIKQGRFKIKEISELN